MFARNTQDVIRLFVRHFGNVGEAHNLETNYRFSIELPFFHSTFLGLFVGALENFRFCHVLHEVLVIIHVPHDIIEVLLRKWENFGRLKSDRLLLRRSRQVGKEASRFF